MLERDVVEAVVAVCIEYQSLRRLCAERQRLDNGAEVLEIASGRDRCLA